jgi:hypothetical protein
MVHANGRHSIVLPPSGQAPSPAADQSGTLKRIAAPVDISQSWHNCASFPKPIDFHRQFAYTIHRLEQPGVSRPPVARRPALYVNIRIAFKRPGITFPLLRPA